MYIHVQLLPQFQTSYFLVQLPAVLLPVTLLSMIAVVVVVVSVVGISMVNKLTCKLVHKDLCKYDLI